TGVGGVAPLTESPLPSRPLLPSPQQNAPPPRHTTHVCVLPLSICTASMTPITDVGTFTLDVVPICPLSPATLLPMHETLPSPCTIDVSPYPAPICTASDTPNTVAGSMWLSPSFVPISPYELSPQHASVPLMRSTHAWLAPTASWMIGLVAHALATH